MDQLAAPHLAVGRRMREEGTRKAATQPVARKALGADLGQREAAQRDDLDATREAFRRLPQEGGRGGAEDDEAGRQGPPVRQDPHGIEPRKANR